MKRVLIVNSSYCGSGDFIDGKIYEVVKDWLYVSPEDDEDGFDVEATQENLEKYPNADRWVRVEDESSYDEICIDEENSLFFENDEDLAHELINRVHGLAATIVNMSLLFRR